MKQADARRTATRRNREAARRMPLFAHTGTLETITPTVSPEQVIERHEQGYQAAVRAHEQREAANIADADFYVTKAYEILGPDVTEAALEYVRSRFAGNGPEYVCDHLLQLIAHATNRTPQAAWYWLRDEPDPYAAYALAHPPKPSPEHEQATLTLEQEPTSPTPTPAMPT